jgi:hypothetical protein
VSEASDHSAHHYIVTFDVDSPGVNRGKLTFRIRDNIEDEAYQIVLPVIAVGLEQP